MKICLHGLGHFNFSALGFSNLLNLFLAFLSGVSIFSFSNVPVFASEEDYYSEHAKGWHWYEAAPLENEEDENKTENSPSSAMGPIEQMGVVQRTIKRALDKAVLEPTPENVKDYITLQGQLMARASEFSRVWKEVLLARPGLDYSLLHPTNNLARQIESDEENKKEEMAIKILAQQSGLFFFYRSTCPYCRQFAPIVKAFAARYHMAIVPISTDGIFLPEFPASFVDQGQAKLFHVTVEPSLYAVDPYTKKAYPISYGFMGESDLKKRILDIATHFGKERA